MASIFSKIVAGSIPSYKVAENDSFLAFLDAFPLRKGHVLVVPKQEIDYLFDLDQETYLQFMDFTKKVAEAIKNAIPCARISMHVIGLEVPHAHIHLIPINTMSDCDFGQEKLQFTKAEFEETAKQIASQIKL